MVAHSGTTIEPQDGLLEERFSSARTLDAIIAPDWDSIVSAMPRPSVCHVVTRKDSRRWPIRVVLTQSISQSRHPATCFQNLGPDGKLSFATVSHAALETFCEWDLTLHFKVEKK